MRGLVFAISEAEGQTGGAGRTEERGGYVICDLSIGACCTRVAYSHAHFGRNRPLRLAQTLLHSMNSKPKSTHSASSVTVISSRFFASPSSGHDHFFKIVLKF